MSNPENEPSIRSAVAQVARGDLTTRRLVSRLLERISDKDPTIHAWAHLDASAALRMADALDQMPDRPLRGLVFAAKDNFDTCDMPTRYGSSIHDAHQPGRDASTIASLRMGGGLLLGKTVTTEFAHVHPGPTRNPWNENHTPGGSSSGSAAAVGSGMVPLAFGSQTTGSVIRPAAFCGVVGFKPTHGDINPSGMLANSPSFDTVGMMTRDVQDMAFVHAALIGAPLDELDTLKPASLRLGVCRTPWWDRADAQAQASLEQAVDALAKAGVQIQEFDDAGAFDELDELSQQVSGFEFARTMAHERIHALDDLSDALRNGRMQTGLDMTYEKYAHAQQKLRAARETLDRAFDGMDAVLSLPAPGAAPEGIAKTGDPIFNMPWTSLHAPAVTIPVFKSDTGMPMGLQLTAGRHADRHLLTCAQSVSAFFDQA